MAIECVDCFALYWVGRTCVWLFVDEMPVVHLQERWFFGLCSVAKLLPPPHLNNQLRTGADKGNPTV
jgi:hypothetical protein